jgi:hypothetical protein
MSGQLIVTAPVVWWDYDPSTHKINHKCLLLTIDGMAVIGSVSDMTGYIAHAPLPKRDKAKEKELGL